MQKLRALQDLTLAGVGRISAGVTFSVNQKIASLLITNGLAEYPDDNSFEKTSGKVNRMIRNPGKKFQTKAV
jgi:hypothetical protein